MRRARLAVIGFGRLGHACARAIAESGDFELGGVVRRADSPQTLPRPFQQARVAGHVADLGSVHAALVCVPSQLTAGVARELLQNRVPIVECAILEGRDLRSHREAIAEAARHHRMTAVVGAGWNPGVFPLLRRTFEMLVPNGQTMLAERAASNLHHTEAAHNVAGVRDALATEFRDAEGRLKRCLYVEPARDAAFERVRAAIEADPLFAGEDTLIFPVDSVAALEGEASGVLLERRGTARSGAHQNLLLEGRFDVPTFAARTMLDAARRLPSLTPGMHCYSLWA